MWPVGQLATLTRRKPFDTTPRRPGVDTTAHIIPEDVIHITKK